MDAREVKSRVSELARRGDLKSARDLLEDAVHGAPQRADLRFLLGQVYARLGQFQQSEAMLTAAHALDPTDQVAAAELEKVRRMLSNPAADVQPRASSPQSAAPIAAKTMNDISLPETQEELREFARRDFEKQVAVQRNRYRAEWYGLPWFSKIFGVALFAFVLGLPVYFLLVEPRLPVTMPDVRGMSEMEARSALSRANLENVSTRKVTATDLPIGAAAGTEPRAGSRIPRTGEVSLLVAGAKVRVPSVKGLDWGRAIKRLQEASINVDTDLTGGTAKGTKPPAGALVEPRTPDGPGTPVLLIMSGP